MTCQVDRMACAVEGEPDVDMQRMEPGNSKLGDLDSESRQT